MTMTTWKKGRALEHQVFQMYKDKGYEVWMPPKTRFGAQDIFGIGDIIASNPKELLLIAVAKGRVQTGTRRKIEEMIPKLPKYIKVHYYVLKSLKEGLRMDIFTWMGQSSVTPVRTTLS